MGLIIKNKIAQLKKGYPTVSDKYNVQGGIYVGDTDALHFGDLVFTSGVTGHYKKYDTTQGATNGTLAGICLATNVKLANRYPGDSNVKVETLKGEAFNLLVRGFVAVEIADATAAYLTALAMPETTKQEKAAKEAAKKAAIDSAAVEGAPVYLVNGELATTGTADQELKDVYFMGVAEIVDGAVVAEINYKM